VRFITRSRKSSVGQYITSTSFSCLPWLSSGHSKPIPLRHSCRLHLYWRMREMHHSLLRSSCSNNWDQTITVTPVIGRLRFALAHPLRGMTALLLLRYHFRFRVKMYDIVYSVVLRSIKGRSDNTKGSIIDYLLFVNCLVLDWIHIVSQSYFRVSTVANRLVVYEYARFACMIKICLRDSRGTSMLSNTFRSLSLRIPWRPSPTLVPDRRSSQESPSA
jgi:hypothetical protein